MGSTSRPNGFPTLSRHSVLMDKSQRMREAASRGWPSNINNNPNPWSGFPAVSQHNTADSRGSDEHSPTAAPGPAQPNGLAEHMSWTKRVGAWSRATGAEDVSPTHTQPFPPRQSISQASSMLNGHGIALPAIQTFDPQSGEERPSSGLYSAIGTSQLAREVSIFNRRNSADPGFVGVSQNRSSALHTRQLEASASRPTHYTPAQYAWGVGGHVSPQNQRSSFPTSSISMPLEDGGVSAPFTNGHSGVSAPFTNGHSGLHNLEETFDQDLTLEDTTGSFYAHRGSVERSSPAGSSYLPRLNSPRNSSGTFNLRPDRWGRPVPRSANLSQDLDRQQQQQQGSQYPAPAFYPSYLFSTPSQVGLVHDHNQQSHNHRSQIPSSQPDYRQQFPVIPSSYSLAANQNSDPAQGVRSALLDEFRATHRTNRRWELREIYGHIVEFSGDQHGSRFIQERLKTANSEEKERVFQEIMQNAVQLMKDVFGNYVIQRFFEHGDQVQKKLLAAAMIGRVADLSTQMYSCRVVQKALEHVLDNQQREIVDELKSEIVHVAKNPNGNHVVQKAVQMFPKQCIPFLMKAIKGQIEQLAAHQYACRVIQRILESGTEDEKKMVMADIYPCAAKLMTDQFGNYVIQHIIERGQSGDRSIMIRHVIDRILALSRHKYASNVVEKCIVHGTVDEKRVIRSKFTTLNSDGTSPLQVMIKDQYGNYVIQKLLGALEGSEAIDLALSLNNYVSQLKKQGTSRHTSALERLTESIEAVLNSLQFASSKNGRASTSTSAPSPPNLAVEVGSAVPTPLLTTEQNTPQSSSPPSTHISTADEASEETLKDTNQISPPDKAKLPVHVQEN